VASSIRTTFSGEPFRESEKLHSSRLAAGLKSVYFSAQASRHTGAKPAGNPGWLWACDWFAEGWYRGMHFRRFEWLGAGSDSMDSIGNGPVERQ
jgi:hypothetical protein